METYDIDHGDCDGNHDGKSSPGGSCGESDEAGDEKNDSRYDSRIESGFGCLSNKGASAKRIANVSDGESQYHQAGQRNEPSHSLHEDIGDLFYLHYTLGSVGESADYELREFLTERAQEVARGVERATAFLETGELGSGIGRLYLCGGGVGVPGLAEVLAERLQVETHVASAVERVQVKADAADFLQLQVMAPMLMLAVGLELRRIQ